MKNTNRMTNFYKPYHHDGVYKNNNRTKSEQYCNKFFKYTNFSNKNNLKYKQTQQKFARRKY